MLENDPKVVAIGGGTGIATFLKGLKRYPVDITAIISVADDGGSSKQFRDEMHMPPPGDIRKVILSLSEVEPILAQLFKHRFKEESGLTGHPTGNILLAAMQEITGDFVKAIQYLSQVLNVKGTVLPVANKPLILCAELENGKIIEGESRIPDYDSRIKRVFFKDEEVIATKEAVKAILEADIVVIGPGSLYTSIIPNIIIPEIREALKNTKAPKIYISNIMTQPGETTDYTISDHVNAIEKHAGANIIDIIIANDQVRLRKDIYEKYINEKANLIKFDAEELVNLGKVVYTTRLIYYDKKGRIRHDTRKLASQVFSILLDVTEGESEHIFI